MLESLVRPGTPSPVEFLILPLDERYALAYYFHLRSPDALDTVFVDAAPGKTLLRYNDLRVRARINAHSWASRRPYGKAREVNNI